MEETPRSENSDTFSEIDLEGRRDYSVSELISFLKSAFRLQDFTKAEELLRMREEKQRNVERDLKELEVKLESEFGKKREVLEKKLEAFRNQCIELTEMNEKVEQDFRVLAMEVEKKERDDKEHCILLGTKLGEMESRNLVVEEELRKYKSRCCKLEERIAYLEEDYRAICGSEQIGLEKIAGLEEEMKKEQDKFVELKVENRDLEAKVLKLEEENSYLRGREQESREEIKAESKDFFAEVCCEEKGNKGSCKVEHQNEVEGGRGSSDNSVSAHLQLKGTVLNHNGVVHASADVGSPGRGSFRYVPGAPPVINVPSESFRIVENIVDPIIIDKDYASQVRKKLFNKEESSDKKKTPLRVTCVESRGDIIIIDSDDEMDITPTLNSNVGNSGFEDTYGNLEGTTQQKSLKRMHFDQSSEVAAEENASSCEESIPISFTPKRKRASTVITSDNEEEDDDDDDDKVPLAKLKMKKLAEVTDKCLKPSYSPVNWSSESPTTSSGKDNVEKSITPSRRRIIPLRQCEEAKNSYRSHSIGESPSPKADNVAYGASGASYRTPQKTAPESPKVEEVESDSEGESLGGFIVQGSDGSDSEGASADAFGDEAESGLAINQLLEIIRRKKKTSKWEYEADMLSSFSKDPELCMKAVCALYRQQTADEKSMKGSLYANNRGFNKFDALKGSVLAEFLTDGDSNGPLKKSVEELEKHDPKALDCCSQLASRYSKQLFQIYQNKEDPHFLPC